MGIANQNNTPNIDLDRSEIESALDRLLSNHSLRLSERNRKFLNFVVRETVAGRGDRIKAYSIGVDVFCRGEDFDPNVDPIVRIEATRLRSALEAFYKGPGREDDFKIFMKPGSYIPVFEGSKAAGCDRPALESRRDGAIPASRLILVSHGTDPRNKNAYACGALLMNTLAQRLIARSYRVFFAASAHQRARGKSFEEIARSEGQGFGLDISILPITGGNRHVWSISDVETGELCGLEDFDQILEGLPSASLVNQVTDKVFHSIAAMMNTVAASQAPARSRTLHPLRR